VATEGDKLISLPTPPPPRPAARRDAIEAALRRFDGGEEATAERPRRVRFAALDRRGLGALATAAIVALVGVPIAVATLRDMPRPAPPELKTRYAEEAAPAAGNSNLIQAEPPAEQADAGAVANDTVAPNEAPALKPRARAERMGLVEEPKVAKETPPPGAIAAAAPPPPPPPAPAPPAAPQYAADSARQETVVTGSRVAAPTEDRANRRAKATSPLVTMDTYGDFLTRLQRALKTDNRRAVSGMVGFPLTVNVDGRSETYRSRRAIESDFDRIFTPAVKADILGQKPYSLRNRADGRTKGTARIWFAPACFDADCTSAGPIRIREVTP
jgi:hypothetical protein